MRFQIEQKESFLAVWLFTEKGFSYIFDWVLNMPQEA